MQIAAELGPYESRRPIAWCKPCGRSYSARKFETLSQRGIESRGGYRYRRGSCACGEVVRAIIHDERTELEKFQSELSLNRQAFERRDFDRDARFVVACGIAAVIIAIVCAAVAS